MELSQSKWLITSLSPGSGEKLSKFTVASGDVAGMLARFAELQRKAQARTARRFPLIVIQEAGLDGFWIHRVLGSRGDRKPRRRSGLDRGLAAQATRQDGQDRWRDADPNAAGLQARRAPGVCDGESADAGGGRPPPRLARAQIPDERTRAAHQQDQRPALRAGHRGYEPHRRDRRERLDELTTGDGRPLPAQLKAQISRELDRLELVLKQIRECEQTRDALLTAAQPVVATEADNLMPVGQSAQPAPSAPAMLLELKGIGPETASVLWLEGLSRQFDNRRQVAAYAGLAPSHWQSGKVDHDQGVSKAGNPRLRTSLIQLAWLWVRHQPNSALTIWFKERVAQSGGRIKKTTIVALARKLLVALWKYVNAGVVIEGAIVQSA